MINIIFIITGLNVGGAERMLFQIVTSLDKRKFKCNVISLSEVGEIGKLFQEQGIEVTALQIKDPFSFLTGVWKMRKKLLEAKPHIVQTWMYHADFIGGIVSKTISRKPLVIWNIRHSTLIKGTHKFTTRVVARICGIISHFIPDRIICCSKASVDVHKTMGYCAKKMHLIFNGFDTSKFAPNLQARSSTRSLLGISSDSFLIGTIARFHAQKGYESFLTAAKLFEQKNPKTNFVLIGKGFSKDNTELLNLINKLDIKTNVLLLGYVPNPEAFLPAFDIFTMSSHNGEGFPNALGEAMACGIPAVATNVGDAAFMLRDVGIIVPPRSPEDLAKAWNQLKNESPDVLEKKVFEARERICKDFNILDIANNYQNFYLTVANAN